MWRVGKGVALALILGSALAAAAPALAEETNAPKLNVGGLSTGGGSIKGIVKFEGKQAARKEIAVAQDPACVANHKDKPLLEEKFVFGDNNTLQNVFVWVSKGLEGKTFPMPNTKPELDQEGCSYVPHVMGVVKGQDVKIKNSDSTQHNVHAKTAKDELFNSSSGPGVSEIKKFNKADLVTFKCDIHPWMGAYVHVVDHPFFAVTQQDGTFEIKGLPPGEYELSVWHEFARFAPDKEKYSVKVEEGKASEVTITYAPKKS